MTKEEQKLQREIANTRGYNVERFLTSPTRSVEDIRGFGADGKANIDQSTGKSPNAISGKRKYKRHPKVCPTFHSYRNLTCPF